MKKNQKNEMRQVCRKIAVRQLLEHKMLSICMITAVMLTMVLFTTAFSAAFYFRDSIRQAEMEHAAWKAHGAVMDVSKEQYAAMQVYDDVLAVSSYIHLGFLEEEAQDEVVEIQYSEEQMAEWMYYGLLWGHMPQGEQEIAVSSQLLENKGIPQESGAEISIRYTVNGVRKEGVFTVCGVYEQRPTSAEVVFISEQFCRKALAETAGEQVRDSVLGSRVAEVLFADTFHLQRDMEKFVEYTGFAENKWILNPAFAGGSSAGPGAAAVLAGVLACIMACGYFIIYNIYTISVMQDTRFYGSLAVLGFQGKEIRSIVKMRTDILCAAAIPLGFLPGVFLSAAFLPRIMESLRNFQMQAAPQPAVFVCAAVFSYLTVKASSRRPARMVAKMEPVLVKKYVTADAGRGRASRNGQKLMVMAWKNVARDRKKSLLICASIMMCVILSALFYTISAGLDLDLFVQDAISCDFLVGSRTYFNQVGDRRRRQELPPADPVLRLTAGRWEGAEACGGAGVTWTDVLLDQEANKKHLEIAGEDDQYQDGVMHDAFLYGIDEYLFRKMDLKDANADWEQFATGNYVVVSGYVQTGGRESCWQPGDNIRLEYGEHSKEYTVIAIGDIPYDCSARFNYSHSVNLYLPMQEWTAQTGRQDCYMYAFDVEDSCEAEWEERLAALAAGTADLSYTSRMTFRGQFQGFAGGIRILGVSVSIILGMIGLMNFVNVIYSSIYNRRRELAVMQSIGMGVRQVYVMLSAEGGYYMLSSWLGGVAAGVPLVYFVVSALGKEMEFFRYRLQLMPYLAFGAACGILAVCVPCMIFYGLDRKEDLLYRLRHD